MTVTYINIEPEWGNIPAWNFAILQMYEGHMKVTKENYRMGKKVEMAPRFKIFLKAAEQEIEFWSAIRDLARKEIMMCEGQERLVK